MHQRLARISVSQGRLSAAVFRFVQWKTPACSRPLAGFESDWQLTQPEMHSGIVRAVQQLRAASENVAGTFRTQPGGLTMFPDFEVG